MRPASTLLTLVVVLGFAREAAAWSSIPVTNRDYTVKIAGRQFGFADSSYRLPRKPVVTALEAA
jgi:hypothetical protein